MDPMTRPLSAILSDLADDEAAAKTATPGPWHQCGQDRGGCQCGIVWLDANAHHTLVAHNTVDDSETFTVDNQDKANAAHAAHNDPPRVLARAADLRAVVAMAERLRQALGLLSGWINSDAVKGMGTFAAVHGYSLEAAWNEQGASAWDAVKDALAEYDRFCGKDTDAKGPTP